MQRIQIYDTLNKTFLKCFEVKIAWHLPITYIQLLIINSKNTIRYQIQSIISEGHNSNIREV